MLEPLAIRVLHDLNPWWSRGLAGTPALPSYRRSFVGTVLARLRKAAGLIEILRGPRQVGKTTAVRQMAHDLLRGGVDPRSILFVRFDEQILRDLPGGLSSIVRWFRDEIRKRPYSPRRPAWVMLDEIHKLRLWDEQVKHVGDTFPLRLLLTGSSSVLVTKGGRESLAGRTLTTHVPVFQFREVLEAWAPRMAKGLPVPLPLQAAFDGNALRPLAAGLGIPPGRRRALERSLDVYFRRGGYPRLHSGDVPDDQSADYLLDAVFDRVLGVDIPEVFPVGHPQLLRHVYTYLARHTGEEISQLSLTESANAAGYHTNQPTVGKYISYLADALLVREFRRFPLSRKANSRAVSRFSLTDLGVRNAVFRDSPVLSTAPPDLSGPLVETLVQGSLRGPGLAVHTWRDHEIAGNRKSPLCEVDFVVEAADGTVVPVEVKFRRTISGEDIRSLRIFMERFQSPCGLLVTRDSLLWNEDKRILSLPLLDFLVRFGVT